VVVTLWATGFLAIGILIAWLVSLNVENTSQVTRIVQGVIVADLLWYLLALKMVQATYRSRIYQMDEDEITIRSGWWTESVRHIPFSSVIAFEMRWDWLDRWLEIGTLEIQITSRHHIDGSRIRLTGVADVENVAQLANQHLQRMQSKRLVDWIVPDRHQEHGMVSHRY
jgi:membrane protein YdbS with pleckstrin-like domain